MFHEFGFFALCVLLSRRGLPWLLESGHASSTDASRVGFLRAVFGYSAAYYALWWFADFLIVFVDPEPGWALRIVPNQLYYALWVPFVYARFFSAPIGKRA